MCIEFKYLNFFEAIGFFMYDKKNDRDIIEINEKIDELINDDAFLAQLVQSGKKVIEVGTLSEPLKTSFEQVIEKIDSLCADVLNKKEEILSKNSLITKRVDVLLVSEKVQIDQDDYKNSEKSVIQYGVLLDNICAELRDESAWFTLFLSGKSPAHVIVRNDSPSFFDAVAQAKVKGIRGHIKSMNRDLEISFSRYSYGFDEQLKRIAYIESLIKKEVA